jgi:hypothetical protein
MTTPKELETLAKKLADATIGKYYKRAYHPDRFADVETAIKKILTRAPAELARDKERLDWIIQHPCGAVKLIYRESGGWIEDERQRTRQAIDTALKGNTK